MLVLLAASYWLPAFQNIAGEINDNGFALPN
jgi:hypothetical protein